MRADPLRVTVLVGGRRSDVAVPAGLPVAELLPLLVAGRAGPVRFDDGTTAATASATASDAPADAPCHLALPGGPALDPERPLEDQGVLPGAVLAVTSTASSRPAPDDPAEALGIEVARAATWPRGRRDAVRPPVAAVLGLLAAAAAVGHPDPAAGGVVGVVGALALLVLAAWSSRWRGDGSVSTAAPTAAPTVVPTVVPAAVPTAVLAVALACVLAAAAATAVIGTPVPDRAWVAWAGPLVGGAVLATALVGAACLTRRRGLLLAVALPGATLVVVGLLARGPAPPAGLLAGAVVVLVLVGAVAPAASLAAVGRGGEPLLDPYAGTRTSHLSSPHPDGPNGPDDPDGSDGLDADVARAVDLLAGTAGGVGLVLVVAAPVLAAAGRWSAVLGGVLALHLLLRARRCCGALVAAADLGAGVLALTGITGVLLATDPAVREVLAPVLVLTVPLLLLPGPGRSVGARRLGDLAETGTAVALLPLLAVATGLLDLAGG